MPGRRLVDVTDAATLGDAYDSSGRPSGGHPEEDHLFIG